MPTVSGFTIDRALSMEAATVVDGAVVGDNLILTRHDSTTIDAGSVRGPTGLPGISNAEFDAQMDDLLAEIGLGTPVGMIVDYIGTTAPTGYLAMAGQTIANGDTTYPQLWGVLPAAMKSGTDILMPDTRGRISVGYTTTDPDFNAPGKTGGSKTHTLTQAETPLKSHIHTVNAHNHGGVSGNQSVDHSHTQQGSFPSNTVGAHAHTAGDNRYFVTSSGLGNVLQMGATPMTDNMAAVTTTGTQGDHAHSTSISGQTTGVSANHTHTIAQDTPNTTAASDTTAAAFSTMPPFISFLKIIKAI